MTGPAGRVPGEPTGVLDAGARLRRLLAVLAHLARVGEARISELSDRFDVDEATLVGELELAACCGLPPYTPDQLLELLVDEDRVVAHGLDALRRPPRLTPDEGFAVAAAARAMLALPGVDPSGPLASALVKLERALGEDRVQVELEAPEHLAALAAAVARREVVEIDYLGSQRGGETSRAVEPHALHALEGRFYLDAFCLLAGDWRRFQLDRIVAVRVPGERFEPRALPPELTGARAFAGGASAPVARVALPPGRQSLVDHLATGPVVAGEDGRLVVAIRVGGAHFLGRLLLRLGPGAEVLEPPELADSAKRVASRALERYRAGAAH